ncbi:MAG: glycerophosphodiester phosphodiesterase family protein [Paracoccaceae bacterium]
MLHASPRPDTDTGGRIVAHRGASRAAPENTLAAVRLASRQGARWLEFDVSLLGDGTPVLHHDATLERCTDATGSLDRLSAGDLAGIDAGGWFGAKFAGEPLATLGQALDLIGELGLSANLEMKPHGAAPEPIAGAVAEALASRPWTRTRILVSSYRLGALEALRRPMPDQPLAVLYRNPPAGWPGVLAALGACSLHIRHEHLTRKILARAHSHGFHVRVYTINEPSRMVPFRAAGLAGVFTDHPPLFLDDPDWVAWANNQAVSPPAGPGPG